MKTYYEILKVGKNADLKTIKTAFRELAKRYHPDLCGDNGEKFRALKQAFDTLSDSGKRRQYDSEIGISRPLNQSYRDRRINVPGVTRDVFDDLVDVVSDNIGLARKRMIDFEIFLTDDEFEKGTKMPINIPQDKICPHCFGFGGTIIQKCAACNGGGIVSYEVEFDLNLEPPLEPGQVYKIKRGNYLLRFVLKRGK